MPAERFTKKARTAKQKRQWQHVYDSEKARGASPRTAIMAANGVIKKRGKKRTKSRR